MSVTIPPWPDDFPNFRAALEAPTRKVKEAAAAVIALINADSEVIDPDSLAERAESKVLR
jgi:hypothetical protein